jgi:antitoxin (DNA-binding transcriptional repressor) of toxin-antitoxin stability system
MLQVDLNDAEIELLAWLERAAQGEEILIYKNRQPFVRLLPIVAPLPPSKRERQFGSARGLITMAPDFAEPLADFAEYT